MVLRTLYKEVEKDGVKSVVTCKAQLNQVELMKNDDWSLTNPEAKSDKASVEGGEEGSNENKSGGEGNKNKTTLK